MIKGGFGKIVSLNEAKSIIESNIEELENEDVDIENALDRVLAEDIISSIDVPHFEKSTMDGYAVIASDTFGANNTNPKELILIDSIMPGEISNKKINEGECAEIATGAAIPEGADAVIMVEYTERTGDKIIIYNSVVPGDNVIKIGSDIQKGVKVLEKGIILSPRMTGVLSSIGLTTLLVKKKPRVAIFATGNEIIRPPAKLENGKIYDINSRSLKDAFHKENCEVFDFGVLRDDKEELKNKIDESIEKSDLIIVSGGSSLGSGDFIAEVINELGEVLVHGIAIKPGKPTIIGKIKNKLIIGLPGHPTSCLSNFYILIVHILKKMLGIIKQEDRYIETRLSRKVASTIGRYEILPVKITTEKNGINYAEPILKGSSAITTLATADGFIEIEENVEVVERGEIVKVMLF